MKNYELIEHTADIGLLARGRDYKELFSQAALGMFAFIASEKKEPLERIEELAVSFELTASSATELLVLWLSELLYLFEVKKIVFQRFDIREISTQGMKVQAFGVSRDQFQVEREIKAVTYHGLKMEDKGTYFEAQVIFDV